MTLSGQEEITLSEQPSALRDAVPKPSFRFQLGEPVDHRGIVLAPLFPLRDPVARYATLDDALTRGLEITEVGQDGAVPELAVSNPLDEAVLLFDGEEVAGAKQNRILDVSVLVAPRSKVVVPVSCVERGRWRAVSRTFSSAGHVAHTELRRTKARALGAAPHASGAAQGAVWDSVDSRLDALGVDSATRAHSDAFRAHRRRLDDLATAFAAVPGQCGAVLGLGDPRRRVAVPGCQEKRLGDEPPEGVEREEVRERVAVAERPARRQDGVRHLERPAPRGERLRPGAAHQATSRGSMTGPSMHRRR